jgi:hypothetical protein
MVSQFETLVVRPHSDSPGGLNGSVQHLLLSERRYALCRGRSRSHPITAGTQNTALNGLSAWEYAEHISHRSENTTFEGNNLIQMVLHRPVELAPFLGSWSPEPRDPPGACSGGKFVVSRAGEAHGRRTRGHPGCMWQCPPVRVGGFSKCLRDEGSLGGRLVWR